MLRYEDIKDISDGRKYNEHDKTLLGTNGCKGCSYCCKSDMGRSIVLTPYDVYELCRGTGQSFDQLLVGFYIELSMIDGIVLPHLKMDEGCKFLQGGRCSVHQYRPGICRLFPLGRLYEDGSFSYFLQKDECIINSRTPVVISDWLGIDRLEENTKFINKWHKFIQLEMKKVNELRDMTGFEVKRLKDLEEKYLEEYAQAIDDYDRYNELGCEEYRTARCEEMQENSEDRIKGIMKECLSIFFMQPYDTDMDFYPQFDERMKTGIKRLRELSF